MKHILVAILFLLFAALQLNDPDGWLWFIIYSAISAVAILYYKQKYCLLCIRLLLIILGIYTLTYIPDILSWFQAGMPSITSEMKAASPYIELTREFIGLVLCLTVLIIYARLTGSKTRTL